MPKVGYVGFLCTNSPEAFAQDLLDIASVPLGPDGDTDVAARLQYTAHFSKRSDLIRKVLQSLLAEHDIEAAIRQLQVVS